MTSYQKSLAMDVNVHGSGWGAKFSVSTGFKEVKEGTNSYHKTYIESVAKCIQYSATLKRGIKVYLKTFSMYRFPMKFEGVPETF